MTSAVPPSSAERFGAPDVPPPKSLRWSRGALGAWGLVAGPPLIWVIAGFLDDRRVVQGLSPAMFGDISVVAFLLSFVALPSGIVVGLIARRSIARRAPQELRGKAVATAAAIVGAVVLLLLVAMTWTRGFNLD